MCLIFSSLWQIAFTSACTHTHRRALTAVSLSHTFNLSCRIQSQSPESEMDNYASFISEALEKTKCRECVPSWEEIQMLMNRQEMLCTVHYPGPGSCQLYISSHTTANEVWKHFPVFYLAAQLFWAGFGVFQLLTSSNSKFHSAIKSLVKCSFFCLHPWSPITYESICLFNPLLLPPHQVVRRMQEKLGLQESKNTFALYEQNALWEQPVTGSALVADILTRFEKVTCQSLPWKIEQTKKSVIIKPSRRAIKTLWQKAYLSLYRWVWTEQHTVYLSPP